MYSTNTLPLTAQRELKEEVVKDMAIDKMREKMDVSFPGVTNLCNRNRYLATIPELSSQVGEGRRTQAGSAGGGFGG